MFMSLSLIEQRLSWLVIYYTLYVDSIKYLSCYALQLIVIMYETILQL